VSGLGAVFLASFLYVLSPIGNWLELGDGGLNGVEFSALTWVGEYEAKLRTVGFPENIVVENNAGNKHRREVSDFGISRAHFIGLPKFSHRNFYPESNRVYLSVLTRRNVRNKTFELHHFYWLKGGTVELFPNIRLAKIRDVDCGGDAGIVDVNLDLRHSVSTVSPDKNCLSNRNIGPSLRLPYLTSDPNSTLSSAVGHIGQTKGHKKQTSADADEYCGVERILPHVLRGSVHRSCGSVHTLLGSNVRYLPIAGFFFSALAGIGGSLILDNVNRQRNRKRLGWALLLICLPLFGLSFFFGLP